MIIYPTQIFSGGAIGSIQEMLLTMAEYITTNINTTTSANQQSIFEAIQQTLLNSLDIVNAYQIHSLMAQELSLLTNLNPMSLAGLSSADLVLINNRLSSFNALVQSVYTLPINLTFNVNNLTNGQPALQPYDLTSYFVQFYYETPPAGLTLDNFQANSQAMATAWFDALNILNTLESTNNIQLTAYSSTDRMAYSSQNTTNLVNNIILASNITNVTQLWNSLIALPSLLRVAALLYNDPSSQLSQSINTIKFAIINLIYETNMVLASFDAPLIVKQPVTATLRSGETLMDFANRTLGNYADWTQVAAANDLVPPYTGTTPQIGIATPGQKLFLPPFSVNSPLGSYTDAYLGTDIDLGIPFSTLNEWSGDFSTVKGLNNYVGALARRVLTPISTLIYHPTYGSQIPNRIGNITTVGEAKLLSSFLSSALLSDPRTQAVNQITAYPLNFGQIVMTALVTPYGNTSVVPFNLVIIPQTVNSD